MFFWFTCPGYLTQCMMSRILSYVLVLCFISDKPRNFVHSARSRAQYQVTIRTSDIYSGGAGDGNRISIEMFGEHGESTGLLRLNNWFDVEFLRGDTDIFSIGSTDVGIPWVVRLEFLFSIWNVDPWALDSIMIRYKGIETYFPIFDWVVKPGIAVMHAAASISPQVINTHITNLFKDELSKMKQELAWNRIPIPGELGWGLPRYVYAETTEDLPLVFLTSSIRSSMFIQNGLIGAANGVFHKIAENFVKLDDLDDYARLYIALDFGDLPDNMDRWKTDEEFGRQQLNGVAPLSFERMKILPTGISLTDTDIENLGLLGSGKNFSGELQEGKLYVADYSSIFKGLRRRVNANGVQLYCPDAIAVYHVNDEDNLVPILIQLKPGDSNYAFTPLDSEDDWLLAKMYFKTAIANLHQWYYHFLMTHNVMEPFAVALFRNLPKYHPVYKLLKNHLQTLPLINDLARRVLINEDSGVTVAIVATDLVQRLYENFTMDDLVIPEVLEKQGLDDVAALPKFYYRDDALQLWEIQENFVKNVIRVFYKSDSDVAEDVLLQDFIQDVAFNGLGWQEQVSKGLPVPITSVDQLVRVCVTVIFTSSVQHAAVNFQQFEMYKYIPESPLSMRLPPHKKGEGNLQRMMDSLPDIDMSNSIITSTFMLSQYSNDEVYIGEYPQKLFIETEVEGHMKKYKSALDDYADATTKRNDEVEFPYVWLLPDKIPNSIAI